MTPTIKHHYEVQVGEYTVSLDGQSANAPSTITVTGPDGGFLASFAVPKKARTADVTGHVLRVIPGYKCRWSDTKEIEEVSDVEKMSG